MSKLWLLRPLDWHDDEESDGGRELPEDDPWDWKVNSIWGFVVIAENEQQARQIAQASGKDEIKDKKWVLAGKHNEPRLLSSYKPTWLDKRYSICIELKAAGKARIVMRDERYDFEVEMMENCLNDCNEEDED
jgi:hypothetical protein